MKLFKDINFKTHPNPYANGIMGTLDLGDGIILSVIQGEGLYGNAEGNTFEIALLNGGDYVSLSGYDDVLGWQTPDEIDVILTELQEDCQKYLKKKQAEKEELLND